MKDPTPTQCEHPECEAEPIVGVNDHYVCAEHTEWVFAEFVPSPRKLLNELMGDRDDR